MRDAVVVALLLGSCASCARPLGPADLGQAMAAADAQIQQMQRDLAPTTFTPVRPTEGDESACWTFWTRKTGGMQKAQAWYAGRPPSVRAAQDHLYRLWRQRGYQPTWVEDHLSATAGDGLQVGAHPQGPDDAELALTAVSECVPASQDQ